MGRKLYGLLKCLTLLFDYKLITRHIHLNLSNLILFITRIIQFKENIREHHLVIIFFQLIQTFLNIANEFPVNIEVNCMNIYFHNLTIKIEHYELSRLRGCASP